MNEEHEKEAVRAALEFPVLFPIKVLAKVGSNIEPFVKATLEKELVNPFNIEYTSRLSSQGKYHSITALFTASNQEELDRVYQALHQNKDILWMI
jgi:putative lipoic acid-binding regulatory protein